ncbi:MAG TPA: AraC family transcriptional regulator [Holophagaceae bacterium]|nr:AraC family transcriptional regulator [Holophagaceae bacterium]
MAWLVESSVRPLMEGESLFMGAWHCPGEHRPWSSEHAVTCELELPLAGTHLRAAGRRRWVVDATKAMIHRAGDEYLMASPTGLPQRSTLLRLRAPLLEEMGIRPETRSVPLGAGTALLHARLLGAPDPFAREELALHLAQALLRLEGGHRTEGIPASSMRLVQRLEEFISVRFADRLTLEGLARSCGASPFHASRVFRAATGETLHQRLTRTRLRAGLYQLKDMEGRLSALSQSLGFSSHSHFTAAFRREYGCAPAAWAARSST